MTRVAAALATLSIVTVASLATAQGTNFSGTWQLDAAASEIPQLGGGRGGRGRPGGRGGRGGPAAASLIITQTEDTLTIDQGQGGGATVSHYLDGRASTNAGPRGSDMTTPATWDGATLVIEGSMQISTPRGEFSIDTVSRHTLADDGQTLTQTSTRSTPRGDIDLTLVYRRTAD